MENQGGFGKSITMELEKATKKQANAECEMPSAEYKRFTASGFFVKAFLYKIRGHLCNFSLPPPYLSLRDLALHEFYCLLPEHLSIKLCRMFMDLLRRELHSFKSFQRGKERLRSLFAEENARFPFDNRFQHPAFGQRHRQVERGLPAQGGQ